MNLSGTQLKDTYGNLVTTGTTAGSPTTGSLQNGDGNLITQVGVNVTPSATLHINKSTVGEYLRLGSGNIRQLKLSSFDTASAHAGHDIDASSSNGILTLSTGGTERFRIDNGGDISFRDGSANEAFYWDASTARLGLGTQTPGHPLTVTANPGSADTPVAWIHNSGNATSYDGTVISTVNDGSDVEVLHVRTNNTTYANGTSLMLVRGDGNVGIGVTDITKDLEVSSSSNPTISIANKDTSLVADQTIGTLDFASNNEGSLSNAYHSFASISSIAENNVTGTASVDGALIFSTTLINTQSEKMRIDSSGNVLVGKTTSSIASEGVELFPNDRSAFTRDSGYPILVNRLTSDGDLINFRKDGTTVGQIGAIAGLLTLGSSNNVALTFTSSAIRPSNNNGSGRDNAIDLGQSGNRFNDLYLGGSVYLGGTTSANALDDYEEGTWTPAYISETGSFTTMTMDIQSATYTKVGRKVTVRTYFRTDNVSLGTASGKLRVDGLPFTSALSQGGKSAISLAFVFNWGTAPDSGYVEQGSSYIQLQKSSAGAYSQVSDLTTGATTNQNQLILTATYFV